MVHWYDQAMSDTEHSIDEPGADQNRGLRMLERFLIGAGLSLLVVWGGVTLWGSLASRAEVADLERSLAVPDQELWSEARKAAYLESLDRDPSAAIALLNIERLGIRSPVYDDVSELNLNRGVARISGTATLSESDNLGIAGHRDSFFRPLKDIAIGDAIELKSPLGATVYEVVETLIVEPEDVWVLDPTSQATLTLVTCYPFYFVGSAPERFIVRAVVSSSG